MDRPPEPERVRSRPAPGAVLLDFENLVHGLGHHQDGESLLEVACLPALCALMRELVHPGVRRAYGDWRVRDLNQFQVELYRSGFEIVHVLGRLTPSTRKNSSDIRLAVDAIELALREPHLARFVIASGDRDMIEVVRCLQKHGREVVVIAPEGSASADLSDICDRYIPYSEVQRRAGLVRRPRVTPTDAFDLRGPLSDAPAEDRARAGLGSTTRAELLARRGDRLGDTERGSSSSPETPGSTPEVTGGEGPLDGDVGVRTTRSDESARKSGQGLVLDPIVPGQAQLVARARLANYRYEGDPVRRRRMLDALHAAARARRAFSLAEVRAALADPATGLELRPGDVNKCWTVLYQGRAFHPVAVDAAVPMQFRAHVLTPEAETREGLTRVYERCLVYKLLENSRSEPTANEVRVLLGLQEEDLGWCAGLLDEARRLLHGT